MQWIRKTYPELSTDELYDILQLRQMVFIIEQNCPYPDADGLDRSAYHLLGVENGKLLAYARIVFPGVKYREPSIGRVVAHPEARGKKIGRALMLQSIAWARELYPGQGNRISAQRYLEKFYQSVGYKTVSEPYLEDDIPHVEMLLGAV